MRSLGPIVQPPMATLLDTRHDLLLGCRVAPALVRDAHAPHRRTAFAHLGCPLGQELLRGRLIPSTLHQDTERVPVLIACPPQLLRRAADLQEYLIQNPRVARPCSSTSELIGVGLAERARPMVYRLVGDNDAALREEFLDVAIAEADAEGEPNRVRDNLLGEAKAIRRWPCSYVQYRVPRSL